MTTDTASVDALRTRLARAFEVAALRDPSAELAAFEAAVRREATSTDTVAVDRERVMHAARVNYESLGYPESWDELTASMRDLFCRRIEAALDLVTPLIQDAAAVRREAYEEGYTACLTADLYADEHDARVRHEHGERIARAIEQGIPMPDGVPSRTSAFARIARNLSPPP